MPPQTTRGTTCSPHPHPNAGSLPAGVPNIWGREDDTEDRGGGKGAGYLSLHNSTFEF